MGNRKQELYRALKDLGGPLTRPYNQYTITVLEEELLQFRPAEDTVPEQPVTDMAWEEPATQPAITAPAASQPSPPVASQPSPPVASQPSPPVASQPDPDEMPGQRLNTKAEDEIAWVDDQGRQWIQKEIRKPAYPKPRGRRVLTYLETGVKTEQVQNGEYVETFEVAGDRASRPSEVKITLPSYQVGIYIDPRFPFKVHCYNGQEGFNLHDVNNFYGGAELVPYGVKRIYIENDLCYDIRSVVQAINNEYRQLQLTGKAYQ